MALAARGLAFSEPVLEAYAATRDPLHDPGWKSIVQPSYRCTTACR